MSDQCRLDSLGAWAHLTEPFENDIPSSPRSQVGENEPLQSECAYIGKRPLSWASWIPGFSANPLLAGANKEFSHEHLFIGDGRDNIGFGQNGLFSEAATTPGYRMDPTCYDGTVMREAVRETEPPGYYGYFMSNCQTYIERLLDTYRRITGRGA